MKKLLTLLAITGALLTATAVGFAEPGLAGGSLFSLNVLNGPTDITCGDSIVSLTKDDMGVGFGSSLLKSQDTNYDMTYTIVTRQDSKTDTSSKFYYNFIKSGHFADINITQDDFKQILQSGANDTANVTYYKDNLNRYFIKSVETDKNTTEYASIMFFRTGVGIISSDFPLEAKDSDNLTQFVEFANMVKAAKGNKYEDFKAGDMVNDTGLKVFLAKFYSDNTKQSIAKDAQVPKDAKKDSVVTPVKQMSIEDIDVVGEIKKSLAKPVDPSIVVAPLPVVPTYAERRAKNTPLLIIGVVLVLIGAIKGFIQAWRKDRENKGLNSAAIEELDTKRFVEANKILISKKVSITASDDSSIKVLEKSVENNDNQPVSDEEKIPVTSVKNS